jgi:methyl-accepting chemotaxis protein
MNPGKSLIRRFSIRFRMQAAIAVVLGLFVLVGATGLWGGQKLASLTNDFMHHSVKELGNVTDIKVAMADLVRHEKDLVLAYENPALVGQHRASWAAQLKRLEAALQAMLEGEEDDDNPIARQAVAAIQAYRNAAEPVLKQIEGGSFDTSGAAERMLLLAKTQLDGLATQVAAIDKIVVDEVAATRSEFDSTLQATLWQFGGTLALVVLVVVPLTLLNSSSITRPIQAARQAALAIAEGDLTQPIASGGSDEAAELLRALAHMQTSLAGLVREVRQASGNIHTASNEVASGNADLSGRTEQTASNLQQTASAMQQVTHGVQQSAESSRQASSLAQSASQVAVRGGEVV